MSENNLIKRKSFSQSVCLKLILLLALFPSIVLAATGTSGFSSDVKISTAGDRVDKFAIGYVDSLNSHDIKKLASLLDMKELAYRSARTVLDDKDDIDNYVKGFTKNNREKFIQQIFQGVFKEKGRALYLRKLKNARPLIRIDYPEGGHEYMVLTLNKSPDKKIIVSDMFFLSAGKDLSVSLGAATQLMLSPSKSVLKRLFGGLEVNKDLVVEFKKIAKFRGEGKYLDAYNVINELPDAVKTKRVILDMAVQFSQFINDDEYRKQLTLLDKYHGKDETTVFILIDHYFYTGEFSKAQSSIDRLINKFGEDGALLNLKANTYFTSKDMRSANVSARKAMKLEPEFEDAYWTLVTVLLQEKKYSEVVSMLNSMESKFSYDFSSGNFIGNDIYKGFVKSSEFKSRYLN